MPGRFLCDCGTTHTVEMIWDEYHQMFMMKIPTEPCERAIEVGRKECVMRKWDSDIHLPPRIAGDFYYRKEDFHCSVCKDVKKPKELRCIDTKMHDGAICFKCIDSIDESEDTKNEMRKTQWVAGFCRM